MSATTMTTAWLGLRDAAFRVTRSAQAWEIWTQKPSGVLLVCGRTMTVLEGPFRFMGSLAALGPEPVVPVAELLERNQDQLAWYRLAQYRREHASHARRVVVPRPRTPPTD
ncbi:MAG: hypothetical protein ACRDQ4_03290 [Pseudonocardiaceae bacterium]